MTAERVWEALAEIPDPEIPVISLVELGVVRDVAVDAPFLHDRVDVESGGRDNEPALMEMAGAASASSAAP